MFFSYACTMYMHIEQHVILFMKICMKLYTIRLQTFLRPFLMWNNYHQFWHLSWQEMQCVAGSSRSYESENFPFLGIKKTNLQFQLRRKWNFLENIFLVVAHLFLLSMPCHWCWEYIDWLNRFAKYKWGKVISNENKWTYFKPLTGS